MKNVTELFGEYIQKKVDEDPEMARKRLLQGYSLFGKYQEIVKDKRKTRSQQELANTCMNMVTKGLSDPSNSVLVSMFLPCELLYAFHLHPLCIEMFSSFLNGSHAEKIFIDKAEEAGVSETYCSYHKIAIGAEISCFLPNFSCMVNSSLACDANNLTFRRISHERGLPQFYVDVPYLVNEASVQFVKEQLQELAQVLEEFTNTKLDIDHLKEITDRSKQTLSFMNESLQYRGTKYLPTDLTSELYEAILLHTGLGTKEAYDYAKDRLEEYKTAKETTGLNIVWMHTNPFWQPSVQALFNFKEEQHIIATELSYEGWIQDTTDDPFDFMARRLVYSSYNGGIQRRIDHTIDIVKKTNADGVICFCQWGCKQGSGAAPMIEKALREENIPVLVLNGDGIDRTNGSNGQVSTRLEAFLEMLKENTK